MDYSKHKNLQRNANQIQGAMSNTQGSSMTNSFAIANGTNMNNTTSTSLAVANNATGTTMGSTAHHPPAQQPVGQWSALRENAGSAAVGGPLALPPPPGVKGPTNPNAQLALPGQM